LRIGSSLSLDLVAAHDGQDGVRDRNLLESAVHAPRSAYLAASLAD
jgi:hypothetical protein